MDRTFSLLLTALQRMHSVQEVLVFAYTEERQKLSPWVKIILNAPSVQIFKVIQTESKTRSSGPTGCFFLNIVLFCFVLFPSLIKRMNSAIKLSGWMVTLDWKDTHPKSLFTFMAILDTNNMIFDGRLHYRRHLHLWSTALILAVSQKCGQLSDERSGCQVVFIIKQYNWVSSV